MKAKTKFYDYLLQLLTVIIGVFLGMLASEWSSSRKSNKAQQDFLLSIQTELSTNLAYLDTRKPYQQRFFKSLDSLSKVLDENPKIATEKFQDKNFLERIPNWPGLGVPNFENAMFEAAKYSNILPNIKPSILKQLSQTYSRQSNIQNTGAVLLQQLYSINSETKYGEVKKLMWQVMQDYFGAQYNLAKEYRKAIDLIAQEAE